MVAVRDVSSVRLELVDRVLRAVRRLGDAESLDDALQRIVDDVVGVLDFEVAALSLRGDDGRFHHRAAAGPDGVAELLGSSSSVEQWHTLLDLCQARQGVLFFDHTQLDHPAVTAMPQWWPDAPPRDGDTDEVWQPGDTLFVPLYDDDNALLGVLSADLAAGSAHDVEQRTALALFAAEVGSSLLQWEIRGRLEDARRTAEGRFRIVWDSGLVAAAVIADCGTIVEVNDQAAAMLGYERSELLGRPVSITFPPATREAAQHRFEELFHGRGSWVQDRQLLHRDGRSVWVSMHAAVTLEGTPRHQVMVAQWTDITEQRERAARLARQLEHDPLTDLPNRRVLERRLAELFEAGEAFGLLYCDVDGFKSVVDGLGHVAADALIVEVAKRLDAALPEHAVLVRLAGDEFVVLVEGTGELEVLADLADELTGVLQTPFDADGIATTVQMSVGVSGTREWQGHPVDVLREADEALLRAKRRGRGRVELFDPGHDRPVTRADLELEHDLRLALEERTSLEPHFQSVISLTTGAVVGYESLLRWRHPRLGVLLPDRFMPIADRAGLGAMIGWRVLELIGERVPPVAPLGSRPWIAVNVSAAQLGRGALLDALRRVIDSTFHDAPSELHLEITETSLLDASPAVVDELYAAVELGARLSLDDFGTGYSSLTLLRDLPVTSIKIDRSFIAPIAVDIRARTIVQHTIELCQGLGMSTIAEGIETHEQLAWLQTLGCEFGQGFLIDRPTPWPALDQIADEEPRRFEF